MKKLEGLIAAPHTPFNADGSVDIPAVLRPYMGGTEKLIPRS